MGFSVFYFRFTISLKQHFLKMKKTVLMLSVSCLAFIAQAQSESPKLKEGFQRGNILINSSLGLGFSSNQFYINAQPSAGYFFTKHVLAGVGLGITHASSGIHSYKANGLNGGLFARYYFTPQSKFSFFGQLSAGAGIINYKTRDVTGFSQESKFTNSQIVLSPGINIFVSRRVAFEMQFGSFGYYRNNESGNMYDDLRLDLNLNSVKFGINFRF